MHQKDAELEFVTLLTAAQLHSSSTLEVLGALKVFVLQLACNAKWIWHNAARVSPWTANALYWTDMPTWAASGCVLQSCFLSVLAKFKLTVRFTHTHTHTHTLFRISSQNMQVSKHCARLLSSSPTGRTSLHQSVWIILVRQSLLSSTCLIRQNKLLFLWGVQWI